MTRLAHRSTRAALAIGTITIGTVALAPLSAATASATPSAASTRDAHVTIVHGVRGLVANVRLDGKSVLTSFAPKRSAGPLAVPPGRHHIVIVTSSADAPVLSTYVTLTPGEHMTAALGLDANGKPHLFAYPDALRRVAASPATIVMRDIANTKGLHAMIDGKDDGTLRRGQQLIHSVTPGRHTVSLVNPKTHKVVVAPQRVPVSTGAATALYLIGSSAQKDLGWVATRVVPADAAPTAVQTGNSGLAAPSAAPWWAFALSLSGLAGLAGVGASMLRRRRHATTTQL